VEQTGPERVPLLHAMNDIRQRNALMTSETKIEGEGSRTAARQYNEKTQDFTETADVEAQAQKAKDALNSDQAEELKQAEDQGKSHAKK
jgi:hypothetical protein